VVFSAAMAPAVTNLKMSGRLEVGSVLKGTYTFNPGEGEASDRSLYYWGEKGATAGQVATAGKTVGASGQAGDYTLTAGDAGKVIELAVEAKNGQGTTGNVVTLATDADAASGNATTGGNGAGGVTGALAKPVLSPDASALKAKNTGSLSLTVNVTDVLGQRAVNQPVTLSVVSAANRQNKAETPTLLINGQTSWSGVSDGNGRVTVTLTDPQGLGVKTLLNITTGTGAGQTTAQTSAIFTVLTSPDVPQANYYGHMSNTITVNGVTFKRPPLKAEFASDTDNSWQTVSGEHWSGVYYPHAVSYCGGEAKMPTQAQLEALRSSVGGDVTAVHGWPGKGAYYWSTTKSGANHVDVDLDTASTNVQADDFGNSISCLQ
jgi:adhesin/invasin